MKLNPASNLSEAEIKTGLKYVIGDGLATEAMTTLTGGAFLVAFALLLGATNFEIGLMAALPTLTNVFQLASIWLVRRYNNRRAISVICSLLARVPLIIIGILPLVAGITTIQPVIFFLFFYYLFASIAGPSWNAWMKDLVPEQLLGTYFAKRARNMQLLNVLLSISLAFFIDHIKDHFASYELMVYAVMFVVAGSVGVIGALVLSKAPEPQSTLTNENIFRLLARPLKDANFRSLLVFNSAWLFAFNLATPFFNVFMMKTLGLSLSYIIGLTILSQLASISTVRMWGTFSDRYSNKSVLAICTPLYIFVLIAWCFAGIYSRFLPNIILLAVIFIVSGIATAGINLSLINIGLKLASRNESIVYLSAKNIITSVFASVAPLVGGLLADYFTQRRLLINIEYTGPKLNKVLHLVSLHEWNFLFLIGAALAFISLEFLGQVKETGEVEKDEVIRVMRSSIRNNLKDYFLIGQLIGLQEQLWGIFRRTLHPEKKSKKKDADAEPVQKDDPEDQL
ncbi:MFS transporter [Pseudoflavitalea sp. G-6-1-2]|uniref:MFS transporter n=1 Tax=Pseudoflavitalea sp. G-6-1-2 TaxID=2728841 RepID=UPI00146B64B1|nr:MFS transporter [Pseudoflavitalea sp. G-6-1-2]NML22034.1 MFS transporter [Pseudoflavitalea sp. G-6-1-2]